MIVRQSETRRVDELILMDVPRECVTASICGPRASQETAHAVRDKASELGCKYFELKIGRSSPVPFFVNLAGEAFIFNGIDIEQSSIFCRSCKEPLAVESELCSWCQIDDSHKAEAAARNIFRAYNHYGILGDYIAGMDDIKHGRAKP
jgi:hypothetical protein